MRTAGKILLALVVFFLVVAGMGLLIRYIVYKNDEDPHKTFLVPRFSSVEVNVLDLSGDTSKMIARVLVSNPLPLALSADSIGYEFYVNKVKVMESTYPERFSLKKNDSNWVSFPVTVFNKKLAQILDSSAKQHLDSVTYEINSTIYTRVKNFHVQISRLLPLFHIPVIKITGITTDTLRFTHAVLHAHVYFQNNNVFDLNIRDIHYRFQLGKGPWVEGTKRSETLIPAHHAVMLSFPVYVNFKGLGKTFFQLLQKGKDIDYKAQFVFKLNAGGNFLRDCKVKLESEGKASQVMDAVK